MVMDEEKGAMLDTEVYAIVSHPARFRMCGPIPCAGARRDGGYSAISSTHFC